MTWPDDGVQVVRGLMPDDLIDAYCKAYVAAGVGPRGWPAGTPYLKCAELLDLCCYGPLADVLDGLVGEPVALHLNLTGWVSTERKWHNDSYLNPRQVGDRYAAAWVALDDITADAGPFEYIPGSHRWEPLTRDDVFASLTPEQQADPDWPWFTQDRVAAHWDEQIAAHGAEPARFLAEKGDVLVWHAHLIHRGSEPANRDAERRAVIAHYSGARDDMPDVRPHGAGRYVAFET